MTTIGLIIVLILILVLPFSFRSIEHNLEYFLLVMGILASTISGMISLNFMKAIFENYLLYFVTVAVLIAGFVFRLYVKQIKKFVRYCTERIPINMFIFLLIVVLGFVSSFITAIVASLILVEIVSVLPFERKQKIQLTVISCFSIGLGAALTPIGEPLATIIVSSLKVDFFYLFRSIGIYIIPCILALGLFGAFYIGRNPIIENSNVIDIISKKGNGNEKLTERPKYILIRAFKVFIFIIALELLGAGFKPLISRYIINLDSKILYWINMSSAVLDNATIAAAEISSVMNLKQIQAIIMGLLLSGGMLIPGNIPNIISAGKLNIQSHEWAKFGIPLGLILLLVYFLIVCIV
ncbi:DUF1646 family protein [Acetivibrio cellulolyticus]|uniref:DUF1646 family protein n=1 Tax=Acetivibrio cellulolyticus TaxID=35830 RepID=UPI0001E2E329|nr:DUF1646 family protein [Acetivibrio cellulolyticus]